MGGDCPGAGRERAQRAGVLSARIGRDGELLYVATADSGDGIRVDVIGTSIGKGFAGVVYRFGTHRVWHSVDGRAGALLRGDGGLRRRVHADGAAGLMFFPEGQVRVYLYGSPCDMRKSFDGLIALSKNGMGQDPLSGHLFVFVNRRGNILKALYWDRSGFCVWSKRLEAGNFISNWKQEMN